MRFDGNWGKAAWTALVVLLSACSSNTTSSTPQDPAVGTSSAALWGCDANGTRVTCTTAIAEAKEQVAAAYACKANQISATCPDASALQNVPGLSNLLSRAGVSTAFANMTWACLVTGKQQYQCVRDVSASIGNGGTPSPSGGDGTPTTPSTPGVPSTGGNGAGSPAIPTTCDPSAWEPYFAALATYEYGAHGVKLTFPVSIFNARAPLDTNGAAAAAETHNVGVPSCHDGEWAMRDKSWLDAVQHGCEELSNAITVMCQQGANYAPIQGACSDTGAW